MIRDVHSDGEEHKHVGVRNPICRASCRFLARKEPMNYNVAGIDVHKKVLMVVVTDAAQAHSNRAPKGRKHDLRMRNDSPGDCSPES